MTNFTKAVNTFLKQADWLTKEDEPMKVALVATAKALDENVQPSLLQQYRMFYKALAKKEGAPEIDPLDELLGS